MPFQVEVEGSPAAFACRENQSVLEAAGASARGCLPIGCRGGGCGVCRVQVLAGHYQTGTMSRAQVSDDDRASGVNLACQLFPRSNLHLRALGRRVPQGADPVAASVLRGLTAGAIPGGRSQA
jgi:ferredoxin